MNPLPSTNGPDGRDGDGRFLPGNRWGRGNPHAKRAAALRSMLYAAVTDDDMTAIVAKLVAMAKEGNLAAIREVLDRTTGKPQMLVEALDDSILVAAVEEVVRARLRAIAAEVQASIDRSKAKELSEGCEGQPLTLADDGPR